MKYLPLGAQSGQREHGHADGHVLGGLADFAYDLAVRPRFDRVHGGRERHARNDYQQVAERQTQNVRVGHVSHAPMPDEHQHQRAVAQHAHDEYHREHHGHDVSFRPVRVWHVSIVVRRQFFEAPVHDDRRTRGVTTTAVPRERRRTVAAASAENHVRRKR